MYDDLKIIHWPDPRLLKVSKPVAIFNPDVKALARRMLELMREFKGVGLAAPQVGHNIRMFVMNATGQPEDDLAYVNPVLTEAEGAEEAEEGCLSLPDIHVKVVRAARLQISARDLDGRPIEQIGEGYAARIWQHETDHLNGILLLNKMGPLAKLATRRQLKELKEKFEKESGVPAKAAV